MVVTLEIQHTLQTFTALTIACKCQGLLRYLSLNKVPGMFTSLFNLMKVHLFEQCCSVSGHKELAKKNKMEMSSDKSMGQWFFEIYKNKVVAFSHNY